MVDPVSRVAALSTYLAHVNPGKTYWYPRAAPELDPPDPGAELTAALGVDRAAARGNVSAWDAPQRRQTSTEQRRVGASR